MTRVRGMPSGRAGRGWLVRRVGTAGRAASLLDRKLRILRREQERYTRRSEEALEEWTRALASAEEWALRAALLGGAGALVPELDGASADVTVEWSAVMGARFPSSARVDLPDLPPGSWLPASSAVDAAAAAYRVALEAAVDAAVSRAAARVVTEEIDATRFRKRAIEDRWLPRLQAASAELDLVLSETEAGEAGRLRLAAASQGRDAHRGGSSLMAKGVNDAQ